MLNGLVYLDMSKGLAIPIFEKGRRSDRLFQQDASARCNLGETL